jgi:hypothetical protein
MVQLHQGNITHVYLFCSKIIVGYHISVKLLVIFVLCLSNHSNPATTINGSLQTIIHACPKAR